MATYMINGCLVMFLDWKTPFELYYKKPDFSYLKVFGCPCYATPT